MYAQSSSAVTAVRTRDMLRSLPQMCRPRMQFALSIASSCTTSALLTSSCARRGGSSRWMAVSRLVRVCLIKAFFLTTRIIRYRG